MPKTKTTTKVRTVRCVDCGEQFDPRDDDARCPASRGMAYHRSEEDAAMDTEGR